MKLDPAATPGRGQWILTTVARKSLAEGYELTHPELRQGMTLKQWKTGNIPVQPYPADALEAATFKVTESYADEVYLEVALTAEGGVRGEAADLPHRPQEGGRRRPVAVSYWLPRGRPELPTNAGLGPRALAGRLSSYRFRRRLLWAGSLVGAVAVGGHAQHPLLEHRATKDETFSGGRAAIVRRARQGDA